MTDYTVDLSECTPESFEQSAIRNGDRVNRVADWVHSEFQRRLRRAFRLSTRKRFPKGYQKKDKNRKTLKGIEEDQGALCPLAMADPATAPEFQSLRASNGGSTATMPLWAVSAEFCGPGSVSATRSRPV